VVTLVALSAIGTLALAVLAFSGLLQYQARSHKRERTEWSAERRDLNDRLAHASDRPWNLPPRPEPEPEPVQEYETSPAPGWET